MKEEKFQELMVELKKTVSTHRGDEVLIGYDEIEKFAELIIRRCAKVADLDQEHECEWIGGNILTQFGVKE